MEFPSNSYDSYEDVYHVFIINVSYKFYKKYYTKKKETDSNISVNFNENNLTDFKEQLLVAKNINDEENFNEENETSDKNLINPFLNEQTQDYFSETQKVEKEKKYNLINFKTSIFEQKNEITINEIQIAERHTKVIEKILYKIFDKLNFVGENLIKKIIKEYSKILAKKYEMQFPQIYSKGLEYMKSKKKPLDYYYEFHYEDIIFLLCCIIRFFTKLTIKLDFEENSTNLLMFFYGNENTYDFLAENMGYELQLKPYAFVYEKYRIKYKYNKDFKKKRKNFNLNDSVVIRNPEIINDKIFQFEELSYDFPYNFPPYEKFNLNKKEKFRRYEKNDSYHNCGNIFNNSEGSCGFCSKYRNIDKLRLINYGINKIIKIKYLNKQGILLLNLNKRNYESYKNDISIEIFQKHSNKFYNRQSFKKIINIIRNFHGETISFYFLWLNTYLKWLIFASFLGIIYYILTIKKFENKTIGIFTVNEVLNVFMCMIISIWNILFTSCWIQYEKLYSFFWGTENVQTKEPNQDSFQPDLQSNFIFGEKMKYAIRYKRNFKRFVSYLVLIFMCVFTSVVSGGILILKQEKIEEKLKEISKKNYHNNHNVNIYKKFILSFIENNIIKSESNVDKFNKYYYTILYTIPYAALNSIFLKLLSLFYNFTSNKLNQWENYQKVSEGKKDLAIKLILFEFINNYISCFIIGFVKPNLINKNNKDNDDDNNDSYCPDGNCQTELITTLYVLYLIEYLVPLAKILLSYLIYYYNKRKKKLLSKKIIYFSIQHQQLVEQQDDMILEYNKILVDFGFVCLFSGCISLTPLIMLGVIFINYKFDLIRFFYLENINEVKKANGIGIYNNIMRVFLFVGLNVNVALILFSNTFKEDNVSKSWFPKVILFLVIENLILFIFLIAKINVLPNWFYYIDYLKELYTVKYFDRNEDNLPHKIFINEREDDENIIDDESKNENIDSINNFDNSIDDLNKNNEVELTNNNYNI